MTPIQTDKLLIKVNCHFHKGVVSIWFYENWSLHLVWFSSDKQRFQFVKSFSSTMYKCFIFWQTTYL